jgi:DNA modification methylase
LGKHRLLCGDSGNVEDIDRLLEGAAVHLVHMDPPYGVKVEPRSNNAIAAVRRPAAGRPGARRVDTSLPRQARSGAPVRLQLICLSESI